LVVWVLWEGCLEGCVEAGFLEESSFPAFCRLGGKGTRYRGKASKDYKSQVTDVKM
jgi:hypothetical protein